MNFFIALTTGCCLALFGASNWFSTLPPSNQWLIVAWVVMLGGCFGSFMNVVIYRVPAGLSVVHPGSRCPKCLHEIRSYDNIPVFSWLILRGRCRDCGVPISSRYPLIEALVAIVFLGLAMGDLLSGGATLMPGMSADATNLSAASSSTFSIGEMCGILAGHALLICTLICAALIEFDGHTPPRHLFYLTLVVPLIAILSAPATAAMRISEPAAVELGVLLSNLVLSVIYGAGLGLLLVPIARRWSPVHRQRTPLLMSFIGCGLVLGTHAVFMLAVATALLTMFGGWLMARRAIRGRVPVLGFVTAFSFVIIVSWHRLIVPTLVQLLPEKLMRPELGISVAFISLVIFALVSSLTNPDTFSNSSTAVAAKESHS